MQNPSNCLPSSKQTKLNEHQRHPPQRPRRSPAELLDLYELSESDLSDIKSTGENVTPMIDAMLDDFYTWMGQYPEMMSYFRDETSLKHVKTMQKRYWQTFFNAEVGESYINDRYRIGSIHAQINPPIMFYFAGVNSLYPTLRDYSIKSAKTIGGKDISGNATIKLLHTVLPASLSIDSKPG